MTLDSGGDQAWQARLVNCSLVVKVVMDSEAECDLDNNAKITALDIPLLYETIEFDFNNLDESFDTVIQGILVMMVKNQNRLVVETIKNLIRKSVSSLMC